VATFEEFLDALNEVSPTRSAAGFAFEPVVKWFLETDRRYSTRLKKVWLWKDWPTPQRTERTH
jgi:predicted helicase